MAEERRSQLIRGSCLGKEVVEGVLSLDQSYAFKEEDSKQIEKLSRVLQTELAE